MINISFANAQLKYLLQGDANVPYLSVAPEGALNILPPAAYATQPTSLFTLKFASQAPSKTRSSVNVALWTPDGRRCLTGTQAGEFCMWDGQSFQFETIIQAHETPVRSMTFTRAGNFLVSGDDGGNIRYWRTNLELVKNISAHKEAIRGIAFAPTDLKFATGSDDSTVRVWDFARVTAEHVLAGHGGDVKCVDWHPSKAFIVSGSKDGLVKLWCARTGRSLGTMHGHKATITAASWHSNGHWVLTGCRDQTCKVWDIRMQAELGTYSGHRTDITQVAWHPLHEEVFVSGGADGSLSYWLAGRSLPQAEVKGAHEGTIWSTAWHPAGHLLATGSADAATKFWCRARPGDPFMEQQEAEQAELAAALSGEAATSAPVKALAPTLFSPSNVEGGAGPSAIPGIGDAVSTQPTASFDIYSAASILPSVPELPAPAQQSGGMKLGTQVFHAPKEAEELRSDIGYSMQDQFGADYTSGQASFRGRGRSRHGQPGPPRSRGYQTEYAQTYHAIESQSDAYGPLNSATSYRERPAPYEMRPPRGHARSGGQRSFARRPRRGRHPSQQR